MSWFEDEALKNISFCNGSEFLNYANLRTQITLQSIPNIVNMTKCKQNCEIYKYDLAKKMNWNVNVGQPSKS